MTIGSMRISNMSIFLNNLCLVNAQGCSPVQGCMYVQKELGRPYTLANTESLCKQEVKAKEEL